MPGSPPELADIVSSPQRSSSASGDSRLSVPALHQDCAVTASVSGRAAFVDLRRSRRRARSGPVTVNCVPAPSGDETRRFAYSVPRRVGTAVDRNLYRRRLRAVASEASPRVPPGSYLIGVDPDVRSVSFQDLRRRVIEAMQRASGVAKP